MAQANIYYFNPTCELAVANGSFSYLPPLLLREMEQNLSALPFVFATENDFVLTGNHQSDQFLNYLSQKGFKLPKFRTISELEALPEGSFNAIIPWGWSPAAHFKFKNLKEKCTGDVSIWQEQCRLLYERKTSMELLKDILENNPFEWLATPSAIGQLVFNPEEIELLLEEHQKLVLKAPLSSSGRGIQIIRKSKLNNANKQWISGILKQQKYLIAELLLEKVIDLSFHFEIESETIINDLGFTFFETNSNGQYKGTYIHPDIHKLIPEITNSEEFTIRLRTVSNALKESLSNSVYSRLYKGFLGVDALLFREEDKLKIQPCIEVNCRMNMGILTKLLEDKVHQKASGKFEMFYGDSGQFGIFAQEQMDMNPVELSNGKLLSGFVPLVEPDSEKRFGAYFVLDTDR